MGHGGVKILMEFVMDFFLVNKALGETYFFNLLFLIFTTDLFVIHCCCQRIA